MPQQRIPLRTLRIGVVINTASGSVNEKTQEEVKAYFETAKVPLMHLWSVDASGLTAALLEAQTKTDVLLVLGGDGTIRTAAQMSTIDGPALIPLPGGTMNLLPRALYGDGSWQEILTNIIKNPTYQTVSGGSIGKERFFIAAIFGAPAKWASVREAVREGALDEALEKGKEALGATHELSYAFNEMHTGTAHMVAITCPLIATTLANDRKVFEAAVIDVPGASELIELASAAAFGEWRDARNVATVATTHISVSSNEPLPILLDGEQVPDAQTITAEFLPEAFRAVVPGKITTKYFVDFDRTIFDTPKFKLAVKKRPTLLELFRQFKEAMKEFFGPTAGTSRRKAFTRTLGTFLSHGRLLFTPAELKQYIYPEVPAFLASNDCTIVTYGIEAFITAKVTSALTDLPVTEVVYTSSRKGKTIRRLIADKEGPFVFVDDAHFQLESVGRWCPEVKLYEIRRNGQSGDGRWPVITSFDELEKKIEGEPVSP